MDGLVQDYSISSALAIELLQSCTKPLMLRFKIYALIYAHNFVLNIYSQLFLQSISSFLAH